MSSEEAFFAPKARLIKILGEHLIRDNTVGVLELIKNSYDADAGKVTLGIKNTRNPESTVVAIEDDGIGMDMDIIKGRWMEPAHGAKDDSKKEQIRTKKGRIPLGEKGVGRFAVQKLGKYLELITRPESKDYEILLKINWDDFEDKSKYINDVPISIEKRKPEYFKGENSKGTVIKVVGARDRWRKKDLEKIQASLIRLKSPGTIDEDFSVNFVCEEYPELQNLDRSDILDRYQFKIECKIDETGYLNYTYYERNYNGDVKKKEGKYDVWGEIREKSGSVNNPECGPISVIIYAWMRDTQNLKNYSISKEHLQELCGINVFRDGFRVLPYGDPGDDWLKLDDRRVNNPSEKLGNRQVIGFVELDQTINQNLIDKTNREGLQENDAFFDMKNLVLGCISKIEQEHMITRRKSTTKTKTKKEVITESLEELKKEVQEIKQSSKEVKEDSDDNKEEGEKEQEENFVKIPKEKIEDFEEKYSVVCKAIEEVLDADEEKRQVFLHLMGVGLTAEKFSHEFERMVSKISSSIQNLSKKYGEDIDIKEVDLMSSALKNEVRLMGATRYVKKSPIERKTSVEETLRLIYDINKKDIEANHIQLETKVSSDVITRIPGYSVAQIFDNIFSNFIYWLPTKSEIKDRKFTIFVDGDKNTVLFTNNGPSMLPHVKTNLFKIPFVSGKSSGSPRGLGMYISSEILNLYNGKISIITSDHDSRILSGVGLKIVFPPFKK